MSMLLYLFLGLSLTWVLYIAYTWIASQSARGQSIEGLSLHLPAQAISQPTLLLYWFSPACGPCRRMSPLIDALIEEQRPLFKINIADDPTVAREAGVRAAPTLMLIRNGVIEDILLGAQSRKRILTLLDEVE